MGLRDQQAPLVLMGPQGLLFKGDLEHQETLVRLVLLAPLAHLDHLVVEQDLQDPKDL